MLLDEDEAGHSPSTLRWFGLCLGGVLLFFAYTLRNAPWLAGSLCAVGLLLTGIYYLCPSAQPRFIRGWRWLTFPIAWLVGHMLLLTVFFGIVLPLSCLLRIKGHDPLQLKGSHSPPRWTERQQRREVSQHFKQY